MGRLDLERYVNRVNVNDGAQADLTPLIAGEIDQNVAEYRLDTVHSERWVRCDRRLLRDIDGRPVKIVCMTIDFTEELRRIKFLEETARTDVLTGLLNRPGLLTEFASLQSADGFKKVNMPMDMPWETTFCRPPPVLTSIGGVWTASKRDMSGLMKEADVRLCEAKAAGKDAVRF